MCADDLFIEYSGESFGFTWDAEEKIFIISRRLCNTVFGRQAIITRSLFK